MLDGGCSSKMRYSSLVSLVANSRLPLGDPVHSDATKLSFSNEFVTTIDTVSPLLESELRDAGILAVFHCLNDIYSCGAIPTDANMSIQIAAVAGDAAALQLVDGVGFALAQLGVKFGKGHTVFGDRTLITLSAVGRQSKSVVLHPSANEFRLVLSRPLGAARLYQLAAISEDENSKKVALEYMTQGHGPFSQLLAYHAAIAADVSGFGLAGAVLQIKQFYPNFEFHIAAHSMKRIDHNYLFARTSCSYELNLEDFAEEFDVNDVLDEPIKQSLFGREFGGPIVAAVANDKCAEFLNSATRAGYETFEIGWIVKKSSNSRKVLVA